MSISASEKEDWAGSEPHHLDSSEPSDLQEELMRVLSKAVQELGLTWSPPEEPVRSKLDSWYFRSTRKADSRASVPFFPDVHEQLVKTWSAPQSARVHSNTQTIFSHVDGAEAHGYVRSPPVEETVAAHLCPAAAKTLGSDISLPSKPCRTTAHLANKAYASDGEAASALHAMAVLQVFQAKLQQAAEGGALTAEVTKDLRAATDFALMATKRAAQAVGKAMGFMVVLQRHLWLNLADLKEADRKMHTFSQEELSPPHSINAAPLAPPQSSAGPPPTQVIAAHPTTKPLCQFMSAWKVIPGISRWLLSVIERGYTL